MKETDIIRKFVLFGYNYPDNFIEKCWEDSPYLITHLYNKFTTTCGYDMNEFFCALDKENQDKLVTWIFNNYKG